MKALRWTNLRQIGNKIVVTSNKRVVSLPVTEVTIHGTSILVSDEVAEKFKKPTAARQFAAGWQCMECGKKRKSAPKITTRCACGGVDFDLA